MSIKVKILFENSNKLLIKTDKLFKKMAEKDKTKSFLIEMRFKNFLTEDQSLLIDKQEITNLQKSDSLISKQSEMRNQLILRNKNL